MATARCRKEISGAVDAAVVVVVVATATDDDCVATKLLEAVFVFVRSSRWLVGLGYIKTVPLGAELAIIREEERW